jgi:4-amino-4-deoxy-L-arabinose transferase-like glycosyltransferase
MMSRQEASGLFSGMARSLRGRVEPVRDALVNLGSLSGTGAVLAVIALVLVIQLVLASDRVYLNYGTETDYVGGFIPESRNLLAGRPLELVFHPPLYAIVVAVVQSLVDDWLRTGIAISLLAAGVALWVSYRLFEELGGPLAGWGALLGLLASRPFAVYTTQATSDLFFLALYTGALLFALKGVRSTHPGSWLACGILTGLCLLTRSNAVVLLLMLPFAWVCTRPEAGRGRALALITLGLALPLALWAAFATATGAPLTPRDNYVNLGMTYFAPGEDRSTGDNHALMRELFSGVGSVLAHDPLHIARTYARDLIALIAHDLPVRLLNFPLNLIFLPGLALLLLTRWSRPLLLILGITVAHALVVNFKEFQPRYYLFVVPLMGAAAAECLRLLLARGEAAGHGVAMRTAAAGVVGIALALSLVLSVIQSRPGSERELAEILPVAAAHLGPSTAVAARKPHLALYTGANGIFYSPPGATLEELEDFLASHASAGTALYLLYGAAERQNRPELAALADPRQAPAWLAPAAQSADPGRWVLYQFVPSRASGG